MLSVVIRPSNQLKITFLEVGKWNYSAYSELISVTPETDLLLSLLLFYCRI